MSDLKPKRKWLLTINNPVDKGMDHEHIKAVLAKFKAVKYWCMCDETGLKDGTYHTHLFIQGSSPIEFVTVKNKFPSAHIDYCLGSNQQNRDYIRKEGKYKGSTKEDTNHPETFEESGEMVPERQGQRNDLINLYDMIKSGMSNYEILEQDPGCMLHIDKIERVRYVVKSEEYKNTFRNLTTYYMYGKAGSGKTRSVMDKYGYENVYRITDYKHPFDNYKGQDVIIFEEFRSSLRIQDMLNYLDGYPLDLPSRYNNKVACFTKVYIISNVSLSGQYTEIQRNCEETWNAFLRRLTKIQKFTGTGIEEMSVKEYFDSFHSFQKMDEYEQLDIPFD